MITRIRTWQAIPGKTLELIALVKEMSNVASRISGHPPSTVAVSVGGDLGEVSLLITSESLDQNDSNIAKVMAHPDFTPLGAKLATLIEGGGFEQIFRHV